MDRNLWWGVRKAVGSLVALRKESVDRNLFLMHMLEGSIRSLSARRAWIEMSPLVTGPTAQHVALRKESVDRNPDWSGLIPLARESLSARRAWIEI